MEEQIKDLYNRTAANAKDIAVISKEVELHTRECAEKHNQVLKKLTENHENLDEFKTQHRNWMLGLMTTLLIACILVILKS